MGGMETTTATITADQILEGVRAGTISVGFYTPVAVVDLDPETLDDVIVADGLHPIEAERLIAARGSGMTIADRDLDAYLGWEAGR